ncbi:uncharacterized protein LOC117341337 [Pecten maximus]|uniref:uncharacterized protein LOC117341337 n=1 Tax=Pecten maximus TaxID=6579 RepID=UPI0014582D8F|nr:uncharacterized protein LOC117341337 [Pecten maximus]
MSLKKSRQSDVSVGQLQNPDRVLSMMKYEELFTSFKKVRGSPQYWKEMQMDMLAKIRQFGPYTFFLTGSAADFHWPELIQIVAKQYGEQFELSYIENEMDSKTKRQWLTRNPVTVARQIDFIFHKLWGEVILSGVHPVGQILNYDIRKEMQNRGTAHFHSAVHVKDAPVLDKDSDEEVIKFIDRYISCEHPESDDELASLVASRQTHHHTRTCKKKKSVSCRFHFPKPPGSRTVISRPLCDEDARNKTEVAQRVISHVMQTMTESESNITTENLLIKAKVTPEAYHEAVQISLKKTTILLKRRPNESCINPYNPLILKALRANMDIQFITDVWACIAYLTSYMCKPETAMSDLMRNACKEATTAKEKLKCLGNVFLKSREVSQHEAVARLLGLPLRQSNIPVKFISTGYPEKRTRMLKPATVLKTMDEDDTDIYLPSIIDKYAARPSSLNDMCLAEFASNYETTSRHKHDECVEEQSNSNMDVTQKTICLKNELGIMVKRKIPQVQRFHYVSQEKDSEKYFFRLLILYLPWRSETELSHSSSYEISFENMKERIIPNIERYEPYLAEVEEARESAEEMDDGQEEIWDALAPQAEQNRSDEAVDDPINQFVDIGNLTEEQLHENEEENQSPNQVKKSHFITTATVVSDNNKYYALIRSLNHKQKQVHDLVFHWCRALMLSSDSEVDQPEPFYIFLSGGDGVGKSHCIHSIYQSALRQLRKPGDNPETPSVVLTAPTGKAAVNIGGNTLHSAFHLPVKQRGSRLGYHKPSINTLKSMRATYCRMKILIIDEVSMVGSQTFSNVDLTLQEIFENDKPFGGISVLVVGDLMQLNPVGEAPVFKGNKHGYSALAPVLWHLFSLHELTDIVRQKEDPDFAQLLSRVRLGQHTDNDIQELKSLETNDSLPKDCLSIFLTNVLKDSYNSKQLQSLTTNIYTIQAKDSSKDLETRRASVSVTSTDPHETGGLSAEVKVAVNARYMHTKNTDIEDGLVNGTTGTIVKLHVDPTKPLKGTIYVKFDDMNIGCQAKKTSPFKDLVPIKAVTAAFFLTQKAKSIQMERTQFPGTLARGITVHKSQGSTFETMIADMETPANVKSTMPGQIYTMLSRAKTRKGLKVCAFHPSKIHVNSLALEEMKRLQTNCSLPLDTDHSLSTDTGYGSLSLRDHAQTTLLGNTWILIFQLLLLEGKSCHSIFQINMKRENAINHNTAFTKTFFSDNVTVVLDGTYIYIGKSGDHEFQRTSYCEQKKRNNIKFMSVVFPDGYVLDTVVPFFGSENDATITKKILDGIESLNPLLPPEDHIIVDRGFREVLKDISEVGYGHHMPSFLQPGKSQHDSLEANTE